MKRKILILSVLAICIATFAAGTIAFFTAEGKAHNVITTGGVEIAVQEWADDEKTKPFENLSGVMPNTTVTKIAEVKNTGASDAWIRVKVEKSIQLQGEGTPDTSLVELNHCRFPRRRAGFQTNPIPATNWRRGLRRPTFGSCRYVR